MADVQIKRYENGSWDSINPKTTWANVSGKPSTYPPSSHTHTIANINNLQETLDSKVNKKENNSYYPYVCNGVRGDYYKVTFPYVNDTSNNAWFMTSFDLTVSSTYQSNTVAKAMVSWYPARSGGVWTIENFKVRVLGSDTTYFHIYRDTSNPAIMYLSLSANQYSAFSITNLYALDSAPSYNFLETTVENISSIPSGAVVIPMEVVAYEGHTHTYNWSDINNRKDELLEWGGDGISGDVSPIGCALSDLHSANRIAFLHPDAVNIEYTIDNGTNWTTYSISDSEKINLCTKESTIWIGNPDSSVTRTTDMKTRITICGQDGTHTFFYTSPKKMLVEMCQYSIVDMLIETKTGQSGAQWSTYGTYRVSGCSGWNDIPLILDTLGGGTTQIYNNWYLRLTFSIVNVGSYTYDTICSLRIYGDNDWSSASYYSGKGVLSSTGHLYSYDADANATFPAAISASRFNGQTYGQHNGITKIGDGNNYLTFRDYSGGKTYESGMYYSTPGNEALVFANNPSYTSWIFANTSVSGRADWTELASATSMQIKDKKVVINKFLGNNEYANYNLDVNGTANATTLYENGTSLSSKYATISSINNKTYLKSDTDTRSTNTIPNDYNGKLDVKGLKNNTTIGISGEGTYSGVLGMRGWSDSSGGKAHEFALTENGNIYHRTGSTTTWGGWTKFAKTSNESFTGSTHFTSNSEGSPFVMNYNITSDYGMQVNVTNEDGDYTHHIDFYGEAGDEYEIVVPAKSGTLAIDSEVASSIAISNGYIQLKNSSGTVISQVQLPTYNGEVV